MRRRGLKPTPRPGYFIDVRTLAAALTSRSFDLAGLANFLGTENRKLATDEHGKAITDNYLVYARQDVQVTWECYCALLDKFAEHNFKATFPHRIFSEASIGKAYFKEMNIRPWRDVQPNFPDGLTGTIMSTYFGGRAEVHHRRIVSQVCYCDFLSMYPTVCILMGLWRFVVSNGLNWRDSTKETAAFLQAIALADLQNRDIWPRLATLVQVRADRDIFPVRAHYGGDEQSTIGLNYLTSETPLWFTLADCIASKILTGKAPRVLKAMTFEPKGIQSDLRSWTILGNPEYRIDPAKDDFYRRIIDLRSTIKACLRGAAPSERAALDSAQLTLKILANATSYGNFVELNVEDLARPQQRECHGYGEVPSTIQTDKNEEPGRYFHPVIATLITGAARLMLAITERLATENGLDWTFCDTDSMAIAKLDGMADAAFYAAAEAVRGWFVPLNPYTENGSILKIEDANFRAENGGSSRVVEPLYCFAISAKRYALFNLGGNGTISIRKASAHGLGHLLAPYGEADAPSSIPAPTVGLDEIGVERWQYDLWHMIVRAALDGHPNQVQLDYHPNLDHPAASRYAATTPQLLRWFAKYNEGRSYDEQVKPNNFLLAFQIAPASILKSPELVNAIMGSVSRYATLLNWPKPIAAYDTESARAAESCFDRDTGIAVSVQVLKAYRDALAQYHLRPERKFRGGDYTDRGITERRHVVPATIRQIGKESNRWEEQFYLGNEDGADIDYGPASGDAETFLDGIRRRIVEIGQRKVARAAKISRRTIAGFIGRKDIRPKTLNRIVQAVTHLS